MFNDISFDNLFSVVSYVYTGEAQMPEVQLASFLDALVAFQLSGAFDSPAVPGKTFHCQQGPAQYTSNLALQPGLEVQSFEAYPPRSVPEIAEELIPEFCFDQSTKTTQTIESKSQADVLAEPNGQSNFAACQASNQAKSVEDTPEDQNQFATIDEIEAMFFGFGPDSSAALEMSYRKDQSEASNSMTGSSRSVSTELSRMPEEGVEEWQEDLEAEYRPSMADPSPCWSNAGLNSSLANSSLSRFHSSPPSTQGKLPSWFDQFTSEDTALSSAQCRFCDHVIKALKTELKAKRYKHETYCKSNLKGKSRDPCKVCNKLVCRSYMGYHLRSCHKNQKTSQTLQLRSS